MLSVCVSNSLLGGQPTGALHCQGGIGESLDKTEPFQILNVLLPYFIGWINMISLQKSSSRTVMFLYSVLDVTAIDEQLDKSLILRQDLGMKPFLRIA